MDGGGDAEGAGGQAAEHQLGSGARDQFGDPEGGADAPALGEFDVDALDASGEAARVLVSDGVLVCDDRQRRALRELRQCLRIAGGQGLFDGLDTQLREERQQSLALLDGPRAVGIQQQPGVRRHGADGPYPGQVLGRIRGAGLELEDRESVPYEARRLRLGPSRCGDADGAGGRGGGRFSMAVQKLVHGDARALADEVEERGLHGRGHGRRGGGVLPGSGPQGLQGGLGVGETGQPPGLCVQQPPEGAGVEAVVHAGDGLSVAAEAFLFDGQPHGFTGSHRGAGDAQRLGEVEAYGAPAGLHGFSSGVVASGSVTVRHRAQPVASTAVGCGISMGRVAAVAGPTPWAAVKSSSNTLPR
jgi:hypothetical protein